MLTVIVIIWFFAKENDNSESTSTTETQTIEQIPDDESSEKENTQVNDTQPTQINQPVPEPTPQPSGFTLPPTNALSGSSFTSQEELASAQSVIENVSPGVGIYWYDNRASGDYYQCHLYDMSTYEVYAYYGVGSGAEANDFFFDFYPGSGFSEQTARALISNNCPQNP